MIVGVLEAGLQGVVIYVADRQICLHALHAHRLELEVGHRPGGILRERLGDADVDR
jgi:hypothetical protein